METSKGPQDGQPARATPALTENQRITRAAGLLSVLTLASRISGLLRDVVVGALFGASSSADAFFVAFRIPNLFRRVVAEGATSTAFVPVFTDRLVNAGPREAVRAAAAVGGVALVVLGTLVALGAIFSREIVALFAPGFQADPVKYELTVTLTAWTFPYLLFVGAAAWAMGVLHTFRRFTAPALGPILLNVAIIGVAFALVGHLREPVYALVCGVLLGGFLQIAVQLPSVRGVGVRVRELAEPSHPAVARVGALLLPALLGGAVYQINVLVATLFASLLPSRSVSYLWYADRIFEFPLGLVAVAIGTAALPSLSSQARSGRMADMGRTIESLLGLVWALSLPAMVGLWILTPSIVSVLLQRGEFTPSDAAMTAWALRALLPGLIGVASARVLVSGFYALELPRMPVVSACIALLVNVVADLALMGPPQPGMEWWGASLVASARGVLGLADLRHAGLALGAAIAATVNATTLAWMLRRQLPDLKLSAAARSLVPHVAAAGAMALVLYGVRWLAGGRPVTEVVTGIFVGAATYVLTAWVLGSREIRRIVQIVAGAAQR